VRCPGRSVLSARIGAQYSGEKRDPTGLFSGDAPSQQPTFTATGVIEVLGRRLCRSSSDGWPTLRLAP
jgi:hypothetical protein